MIVVPVYNIMILPDARLYFPAEQFKQLGGRAVAGERVVLLLQKEAQKRSDLTEASFYPIGVSGTVERISNEGYVIVATFARVNIDEISVNPDHSIELEISRRNEIADLQPELAAEKLRAMKEAIIKFDQRFEWGESYNRFINGMETMNEVVSAISTWMDLEPDQRYAVLSEDSVAKRTEEIEKLMYEFLEMAKVTSDAASAQQQEYQDLYRESAIKKQMEYLQKELDQLHPEKVTDIRRFEMKIEESKMNDEAREEALKVLNRLKQEGQNSAESGMLYDYLDFVTSLDWDRPQAQFIDLAKAREILDNDHSGLKKVKKRIIQQIAVMNLKKAQSGSILLFVGAPGTGKTSIGKSIAKALGRKYSRVSLGGVRDEADIRGHRRTYIGAMPGRIMDGIQKAGVSNPVMVLDEVDKLGTSYNGDPSSALLEVLDPEQNNTFTDHYMNVPYDLSNVLFICTANSTDTIPEPLLNRMEIISFEGYTPSEKLSIAKDHLLPKSMEEMGIPKDKLMIDDEVLKKIISDYTRESGVRGLRKRMDAICRGAAVKLSEDPEEIVTITESMLRDELELRPVHHEMTPDVQKPGVVTGLAWTAAGGEILYIESLFTKGKGGIQITGKLGDVMKESAQIAVSLVKSMYPDKAKYFANHDLHIHVPEGAVPKDGPSAGITLTTAIASLVTEHPVDPKIAMTGEVSLRGIVTAIGGLPEKLLAAQRAGVKKVFIPKENEEDLRDVAEEVKQALTILPVADVETVLRETGIISDTQELSA